MIPTLMGLIHSPMFYSYNEYNIFVQLNVVSSGQRLISTILFSDEESEDRIPVLFLKWEDP